MQCTGQQHARSAGRAQRSQVVRIAHSASQVAVGARGALLPTRQQRQIGSGPAADPGQIHQNQFSRQTSGVSTDTGRVTRALAVAVDRQQTAVWQGFGTSPAFRTNHTAQRAVWRQGQHVFRLSEAGIEPYLERRKACQYLGHYGEVVTVPLDGIQVGQVQTLEPPFFHQALHQRQDRTVGAQRRAQRRVAIAPALPGMHRTCVQQVDDGNEDQGV